MSDNPFAEPGDQDRTIIRPMPGGSRDAARQAAAAGVVAAIPEDPRGTDAIIAGDGPLAMAAAPLLLLLARLRNAATAPDPGDMRDRTRRELRAFERRARDLGVPADQLRLAHYALCAALDDVVLNTPWGNQGRWHDEPLAKSLHDDARAGDGFFDQLRTLRTSLPESRPLIELMFTCLCLGMMGPYRLVPEGPQQLERVRHQLYGMIEGAAPPTPAALAPESEGIAIPTPPRARLPVWVAGAAALALVAGLYAWSLASLGAAAEQLYQTALAAPPAAMPALVRPPLTPPPAPPPPASMPGPAERLRMALADLPLVEIIGSPAATIIRVPSSALFATGRATLEPGPLPERLAKAVHGEPGPIRIQAYTDNQSPGTVAFPSKLALTSARATALRTAIARGLAEPGRLTAKGMADADPLTPNTTPEGRERNRRIDIVLTRLP